MNQHNYKQISIESDSQGVWILTIKRPEALNALNSEVLQEMGHALRHIGEMSYADAKGLIITGSGEKAFVAGADIKEMTSLSEEEAFTFSQQGQSVFNELSFLKIPVIAAVNGYALGGGCELALACDFIYAAENAQFGLPEVSLGLIPGFGGTVRLGRILGLPQAKEWIFTGKRFTAVEALALGLVNKVCKSSELMSEVLKTMSQILSRSPKAVGIAKISMNESWDMDLEQGLRNEARLFSEIFGTEDMKEGTKAFLEKRTPQFIGE